MEANTDEFLISLKLIQNSILTRSRIATGSHEMLEENEQWIVRRIASGPRRTIPKEKRETHDVGGRLRRKQQTDVSEGQRDLHVHLNDSVRAERPQKEEEDEGGADEEEEDGGGALRHDRRDFLLGRGQRRDRAGGRRRGHRL